MCLGIPGKIESIYFDGKLKMGKVNFDGVTMQVCLETTPEAKAGDYVIVHAGFAIQRLDPKKAKQTLRLFDEIH